jgi:hypothetical protein
MPSPFEDHLRKRIVREKWNTPILEWLFNIWGAKYLYLGLPGPEAHDIKLWAKMIEKVIAFEITDDKGINPRGNFEQLISNLTLLNLPHIVYHGYLEDVVLWKQDLDEKEFTLDKFITLFNLDFCNSITGKVPTPDGRKCWRFEAIRELITVQRALYRATGASKFVMLITAYDAFHRREMDRFISKRDLAGEIRTAVKKERLVRVPDSDLYRNTELLRLFMFDFLRTYLVGQNVKSFFLPAVKFFGRTKKSPMIHFCVVCEMENLESAQVVDEQSAGDFLGMDMVTAEDRGLTKGLLDPITLLANSWIGR